MTTIAWDGEVLAGDRMGDYGGTTVIVKKVHRLKLVNGPLLGEVLLGSAGDGCLGHEWMAWLTGKGERPTFKEGASFTGLIIDRKLKIWHVEYNLAPRQIYQKQYAIGMGRGEALATMLCGRNAIEAVAMAARLTVGTGCGSTAVSFK